MTDTPPDPKRPEFTEYGQPLSEWLDEHGITENGDAKPLPATEPAPTKNASLAPDIRAFLWTVPLGIVWIFGGYLISHFTGHAPGTARRLIGLAFIAWEISVGCELKTAYTLRADYPPLGMWQWLASPRLSAMLNRSQHTATRATNNGCALTAMAALAIPGTFAAFYAFTALLAVAIQIYLTLMTATTVTHIGVTLWRGRHKKGAGT